MFFEYRSYATFDGFTFKHLGKGLYRVVCPLGCIIADQANLERGYEAMQKHAQDCKRAQGIAPPTQAPPRTIHA